MIPGSNNGRNPVAGDCTKPATFIVFRGKKRLHLCGVCVPHYKGSGKVSPYETESATDDPHAPKKPGVFTGPFRTCGDEVST